jgi:hypothetical protein
MTFEKWWQKDGRFYDPDTSDIPWFDKRKELAGYAFAAALSSSGDGWVRWCLVCRLKRIITGEK